MGTVVPVSRLLSEATMPLPANTLGYPEALPPDRTTRRTRPETWNTDLEHATYLRHNILHLHSQGYSVRHIAEDLNISESQVRRTLARHTTQPNALGK